MIFSDQELAAMIAALKENLDRDRYPRVPRLEPFRSALAKLDPSAVPKLVIKRPRCRKRLCVPVVVVERDDNRRPKKFKGIVRKRGVMLPDLRLDALLAF